LVAVPQLLAASQSAEAMGADPVYQRTKSFERAMTRNFFRIHLGEVFDLPSDAPQCPHGTDPGTFIENFDLARRGQIRSAKLICRIFSVKQVEKRGRYLRVSVSSPLRLSCEEIRKLAEETWQTILNKPSDLDFSASRQEIYSVFRTLKMDTMSIATDIYNRWLFAHGAVTAECSGAGNDNTK
jgi:hypothetical protein